MVTIEGVTHTARDRRAASVVQDTRARRVCALKQDPDRPTPTQFGDYSLFNDHELLDTLVH